MKLLLGAALIVALGCPIRAAHAQRIERGFTVWDNLSAVQWPSGDHRRALLLGNGAYSDNTPKTLGNLSSPCNDAYLVATSLTKVGWNPSEIAVACNQSTDQLNNALTHLIGAVGGAPDGPQMTLVYLSGHGVQIGQRNYFFGVNAKPDPQAAAKAAIDSNGAQLFVTDATDVISSFSNGLGRTSPSAVLLILDSCRDDAIFDSAQAIFRSRISDKLGGDQRLVAMMTQGAISAPKGADAPWGMSVFYASRFGDRTQDDNGTSGDSRLAVALADKITKFTGANEVVYQTGKEVSDETYPLPAPKQQFPDTSGPLAGDPCIADCKPAAAPQTVMKEFRAGTTFRPLYRLAAFTAPAPQTVQATDSSPGSDASARHSLTLLRTGATDPSSKTVEVFWCSASDGTSHESRALQYANTLLKKVGLGAGEFSSISDIRVTELNAEANKLPINQINSDILIYDPALEGFANSLKTAAGPMDTNPIRSGATKYVAAYFCNGAYDGPISALVYVQAPAVGGLDPAIAIKKNLHFSFPYLDTSPLPDTSPKGFPPVSQVRFYDKKKQKLSGDIAAKLTEQIGVTFTPAYFKKLATPNSVKLIEVWLSPNDVLAANKHIRALHN